LPKKSVFLNLDTRELFYKAYILPLFDYRSVVWGNCPKRGTREQNKLFKVAEEDMYNYILYMYEY